MMLQALSVIVLLLVCGEICAQIYQELEIDLNEGASDYGTVVQAYGSGYIIGSRDDCDSTRCSGLLRFDDSNTMLWYSKSEHFSQQRETLSVDNGDIIYSGYDNSEAKDVIISRMSSYGEEKSMIEVTDTRIIQLNIGCAIEYGQFTICGSQVFLEGDSINIYTCMFWYDNDSGELDTFMLSDVKKGGIWDLRVTPDSMLLASYYYEVPGTGSLNWHRRIEKYTIDKELVWVWDKGGLNSRDVSNRSNMEVLDNGDIILVHTNSDPQSSSTALWCMDSDGEKKWQIDMSFVPTGSEKLYNIRKTANNDIIACGARTDVLAQDTRSGLICRISAGGELLWKRTYADTIGPFDLIGGELLDIVELADGSLVATGFKNTRYVDSDSETRRDRDLWILHMDENGCLADRCGNDLTTSTGEVLPSQGIGLYPNPAAGELCFTIAQTGVVTLYSSLGEQILVEQLRGQDCIDVSGILSGTYILHYRDEVSGQVFTEKVVKL